MRAARTLCREQLGIGSTHCGQVQVIRERSDPNGDKLVPSVRSRTIRGLNVSRSVSETRRTPIGFDYAQRKQAGWEVTAKPPATPRFNGAVLAPVRLAPPRHYSFGRVRVELIRRCDPLHGTPSCPQLILKCVQPNQQQVAFSARRKRACRFPQHGRPAG
jgi:hypothetical protein